MPSSSDTAAHSSVRKPSASAQNRAARLMAVQAFYEWQRAGADRPPEQIAQEYLDHRAGMEIDGEEMVPPDENLFRHIFLGASAHGESLRALIQKQTKDTNPEALIGAILICGAYELQHPNGVDFKIVLSDYVDVTKAFYDGRESGFVNAVLDAVRQALSV